MAKDAVLTFIFNYLNPFSCGEARSCAFLCRLFDVASTLLIAEIHDFGIKSCQYESFDPDRPSYLAARPVRMNVSTLICGAISQQPAMLLEAGGIKHIPFITGRTEKVLQAYAQEMPITPDAVAEA